MSASKVGTRFLDKKILMALISTNLPRLGKNTRPYMSRVRIESSASELANLAKVKAFWKKNLVDRHRRPPLVVRLACIKDVSRWRDAVMVEGLGVGSRSLKGTLSDTFRPTQ